MTLQQRADRMLALRWASGTNYEDLANKLKAMVMQMLSSTRVQKYGDIPDSASTARVLVSSDYSGLGTAEYVCGELEAFESSEF